jgi:hypothetical protein
MAGICSKSNLGTRPASETHRIPKYLPVTMAWGEHTLLGGFLLSKMLKLWLKIVSIHMVVFL